MIRTLGIVFRKEVLETLRDRRALISSLIMGPVFGPLMFIGAIALSLEQSVSRLDEALPLTVVGAELAPGFVQFLREENFELTLESGSAGDIQRWIEQDGERVVLAMHADFGERFRSGEPARILLYSDSSNSKAARRAGKARAVVGAYASTIGALRLQARGVAPTVAQPVVIDDIDLSTPTSRATLVLGMLSYIVLVVTLVGGMYLAIDATAGERERGSLEPLLTSPVPREHLIYGKVAAAAALMTAALALVIAAITLSIGLVPLERIGMSANFGLPVALAAFGAVLPFVLVGAALMTVVASFTRSYKEAQTWLGAVLLVPTLPIAVAGLLDVKASAALMLVPSLSQHLLIQGLLKGEPLSAGYVAISVASTLLLGLLLTWVAGQLYRRERILG